MLVSCLFLIATFAVYAVNKELRNLHGKLLMCYTMSLTLCFFCWALVLIYQPELLHIPDLCEASGYFLYFWLLTSFFWLNVMCFDVFSAFRRKPKRSNRHSFLSYCLYAFGMPILITATTFCIDRFTTINDKFKAGMGGDRRCYFKQGEAELIYVFAPLCIILAINTVLFVFVAIKIHATKKASRNITRPNNNTSKDQ